MTDILSVRARKFLLARILFLYSRAAVHKIKEKDGHNEIVTLLN